ncbi:hypothetical protein D8T26_22105 [Vibrio vulnificus]|nr:hypothetical protein D8T26_22105 [Vibrio vulnificus]
MEGISRKIYYLNRRKSSCPACFKSTGITKHSRGIHNAWQFWFELALVFTAQWFRLGGLRCSPLNAALTHTQSFT